VWKGKTDLEIELKYRLIGKEQIATILADEYLAGIEEKNSREQVFMKAAYFDTEDYILSKNDVAFRVRMEGNRLVASLKWNDSSADGLHMREEVNVPVDDPSCFLRPEPEIFKESEVGKDVAELLNGKPLQSVLEMKFLRSKLRIDTGGVICELSLDDGDIITDFGQARICEMEIELFSGSRDEMLGLGKTLAERHGLAAEPESKYLRGLRLIGRA
jgi:triphosphatase